MEVERIEDGQPEEARMLTIVYPDSREQFDWALAQGYLVGTTPEQREAWALPQHDGLPVLTPDEVLRVAFADPDDPVHEKFDPEMSPDEGWSPDDPSLPSAARLAEYAEEEQRVEALITIRHRGPVDPADLGPADRAPGAEAGAQAGAEASGAGPAAAASAPAAV